MVILSMIYKLFLIFSFLALFVSGISSETIMLSILFSLPAVSFGLIQILKSREKINFPKHFGLMILFTIVLHLYLIFINNKLNPFYFAVIFGEGLAYWLIFFNLKDGGKLLRSLLIKLTLLYALFYFVTKFFHFNLIKLSELFFSEGLPSRHYHFGDLWAFTLVAIIGMRWGAFKLKDWLLIVLGLLFLVVSNARSAYLSLLLGFIYLLIKMSSKDIKLNKIIPGAFLALVIGLFIFASTTKTTLFSRPYFLQSIEAFPSHPLGVGMGNFKLIGEYILKTTTAKSVSLSYYTHNILLEALSGVGVFSILFLIFLVNIARDILKEKSGNIVWGAVLIAILVNFMFDTTYTIPGLIWILFMTLGIFQAKKLSAAG